MKVHELYKKTMKCTNLECMSRVRVGRPLYLPSVAVAVMSYCPVCGSKANPEQDDEENYMETLAESFGIQVELLKQIMLLWDRNKYQRLSDFITALKEDKVA